YADAVTTADRVSTFRFIVKKVAMDHGLHATFMPKPIFGVNGSGMHTHQSFLDTRGNNVFYDPKAKYQLSKTALHYTGGILRHARSFVAVTNPLVNSYKRLVPGYEAPVNVAWSMRDREKRRLRIDQLPGNLSEALDNLEKDEVVTDALGEHILSHFLEAKRSEWAEYISRVQPWEVEKYLESY